MTLLEEVHALRSYLATGAEVGMDGYKNLCNRLPSYYLLARRRGWLSKLLGRSRAVCRC